MISTDVSTAHDGMLYATLQHLRATAASGVIVALTSANSGEGVTHSVTTLINTLSRDGNTRILRLSSRHLNEISCAPSDIAHHCQQIDANLYEFVGGTDPAVEKTEGRSWSGDWEFRRDCIEQLRSAFDYVLIDCPALNSAGDVLSLASLVNGIILIVEADKTRVDQIEHAEKSLEFARGKLIGHILNKRTYNIPSWLYKRL
ncbi:P-loop NTPase family protein [Granulicella arctica]|uniref:hypothetical protein n=1 Tax=Granulicella arctica TaxID=940613 RepID=UPI0021E07159|nr:hypothetical protein [Granulicella arctica]